MKFLFSLFIIVFMIKECNNSKDTLATQPNGDIKNTSEKDVSVEDTIVTQLQNPSGTYYITFLKENNVQSLNLSLTFDEGSNKISGFSGCNRFSGTYTIKKDSISFGLLVATKMYCKKTQDIENLMLGYLSKINLFSIEENALILKEGKTILLTAQKENVENMNANVLLEYSSMSRGGSYNMIQITNKTISIQKSGNSQMLTKPCSESDWNKIMNLFGSIHLKNLKTLKAPTQARLYDGADIANFKVIYNGITYNVPPFDHGNPSKEIEALVNQILSIAGNIE
ncbi:MAG: META domain-containing protein [Bacteroidetes bacterium]|nr:META domain-containing protein [Bacteroidota bacterium]